MQHHLRSASSPDEPADTENLFFGLWGHKPGQGKFHFLAPAVPDVDRNREKRPKAPEERHLTG